MIDFEETFIAAGGAPGCSDTDTPLDDCLIIDGFVLGDESGSGRIAPVHEARRTTLAAAAGASG